MAPRCAVRAFLADITRWNTSCCGMLPSIMVMAAAMKNAVSCQVGAGHRRHKSSRAASASTWSAPPASSAENTAITDRPSTSTIIWMKSVQATATKPPTITYTSTAAVPMTMPAVSEISPADSTLNTSPRAVTCAATQPR